MSGVLNTEACPAAHYSDGFDPEEIRCLAQRVATGFVSLSQNTDPQMAILGKWWLTNNQWISTDLWVNNFQTNPVVFETCLYTFTGTSHGCCCIQESQWRRRDVLEPNAFALPFEGLQRGLRNSLELHIKHPTHLTSDVFLSFPSVHHGSSIPELVEGSISRKSQPV